MYQVYLLTGSNQGDRKAQLAAAIEALEQYAGRVLLASPLYETEAWGVEGLPAHLNQALLLETMLEPEALLDAIHLIEAALGRVRQEKWGIRAIDIDIIYFEDRILSLPRLSIPHPLMQDRNFVLYPLADIAPDFRHPVLKHTTKVLLAQSRDPLKVTRLE